MKSHVYTEHLEIFGAVYLGSNATACYRLKFVRCFYIEVNVPSDKI